MNLKLKKRIMASALALGIISTLFISTEATALSFTKYNKKVYKGNVFHEAFAWTGADDHCYVNAVVIRSGDKSTITSAVDYDGWVQTPQKSYVATSVIGMHAAKNGSAHITARS